ncbi:hypothetical protein PIB30_029027 [Stylosanthes scabra]|uniref:Uncharacterized protein n=1 Tax=Stylosanthes scabra TaxID=79078 RepID=A0ABU6YCZ9_9FABA|nr:hypothetical protein [Stylosanthes scabra]
MKDAVAASASASGCYVYPPPQASYEEVANNPKLFIETLEKLRSSMGTKFIGGIEKIYCSSIWGSRGSTSIVQPLRVLLATFQVFSVLERRGSLGATVELFLGDFKVTGLNRGDSP